MEFDFNSDNWAAEATEGREIHALYQRGWMLMELKRYREAAQVFTQALGQSPDDCFTLCGMAAAQFHLNDPHAALRYAERAIEADPYEEWCHRWRSYCLEAMGRTPEAEEAAEEAVRCEPENEDALAQLAHMRLANKRLAEAEEAALELCALAPEMAQSHLTLGLVYSAQGRLEEAAACNRTALNLEPASAAALNNLGATLGRLGRKTEATDLYFEALKSDPTDSVAYGNLEREAQGYGFRTVEEYLAGRQNTALMSRARQFHLLKEQGELFLQQGRIDQAIAAALRAIQLVPNSVPVLELLYLCGLCREDFRMAMHYAQRIVQIIPEEMTGHRYLTQVCLLMAEAEPQYLIHHAHAALHHAEEAARLAPEDIEILNLLTQAQCLARRLDQAERTARRILELAPESGRGFKTMGDVCRHQGHLRLAEAFYKKATNVAPEDTNLLDEVARAYWKMGKKQEAHQCFRLLAELEPENPDHRFNRLRSHPWWIFNWWSS